MRLPGCSGAIGTCTEKTVPGGKYLWPGNTSSDSSAPSSYSFSFLPDDPHQSALEANLTTMDLGSTAIHQQASPLQITPGQLAAIAVRSDVADLVAQVDQLNQ